MDDPPRNPDAGDDVRRSRMAPDRGSDTGTPRWVKVFGIIAVALLLLLVVVLLVSGGHGPGRHLGHGGDLGRGAPSTSSTVFHDGAGDALPSGGQTLCR